MICVYMIVLLSCGSMAALLLIVYREVSVIAAGCVLFCVFTG